MLITTDRHGDSVQPTLLDGLLAADHHPQHTILIVDTLHQFIHDAHPGRAHCQRRFSEPTEADRGEPELSSNSGPVCRRARRL